MKKLITTASFLLLPVGLMAQSASIASATSVAQPAVMPSSDQTSATGTTQSAPPPGFQIPMPPVTMSEDKKKKLETLWKAYEGSLGIGAHSLKQYMNDPESAKRNPNMGQFIDPKVQEKAFEGLGKEFANIASGLSDSEIDYLIQLYTSPIAKKIMQIETKLWNKDIPSYVFKKVSAEAARGDFKDSPNSNPVTGGKSLPAPFGLQSSPVAPKPPPPPPKR